MKVRVEIELARVEGQNLPASAVVDHIMATLIEPGEVPSEPGQIWVRDTHYRIINVAPVLG